MVREQRLFGNAPAVNWDDTLSQSGTIGIIDGVNCEGKAPQDALRGNQRVFA